MCLENVLLAVHDQVDHAGDFVALAKHQQVAVVRHDIAISNCSSAAVSISPVVDVDPLHDWLRKLLPAAALFILARLCVSEWESREMRALCTNQHPAAPRSMDGHTTTLR